MILVDLEFPCEGRALIEVDQVVSSKLSGLIFEEVQLHFHLHFFALIQAIQGLVVHGLVLSSILQGVEQ
jgi:hypothetical protein